MKEKKVSKSSTAIRPIDLNTCVPGQKLVTRQGNSATYEMRLHKSHFYGHKVKLENGFVETRTHDGYVFKNLTVRDPKVDEDIVEIIPEQEEFVEESP